MNINRFFGAVKVVIILNPANVCKKFNVNKFFLINALFVLL